MPNLLLGFFNAGLLPSITGGNEVVTVGGYVYRVFTSSGTLSIPGTKTISVMGCGGGGAGGGDAYGSGAGAGELDLFTTITNATGDYAITIGAGATGTTGVGSNGGTTTVVQSPTTYLSALGGGGGGKNGSPNGVTGG